ncbi:MAG: hypothetical protein Q8Q00_06945 [Dehalococcoidia bacterium]|nr:hypothetical protein [Dehalococcoidia bacterium]
MPKFTIDLTDKTLAGLQAEVNRYNGNAGAALTVAEWIDLHLQEIAVSPDLAAAIEQLRKQQETDANAALEAAVKAARDELLASLAVVGSGPE